MLVLPVPACGPPPIPGAQAPPAEGPAHHLIWVRTGTAHVRVDGASTLDVVAGEGVWLPPTGGWSHQGIITEPGTVAFPLRLRPDAGVTTLSEPTRFDVPDDWQDWLIQHFNLQIVPFTGRGFSQDGLTDLLRRPGARPSPTSRSERTVPREKAVPWENRQTPPLASPTMPKGGGARAVAEELVRDPALDLTVEEWAARVLSSPRTLRRDFRAGTGLTFEQWRLCCRLSAGVELLIAGYDVDQVAARVGFASNSGFSRAFKQQLGSTPHEFRRKLAGWPIADGFSQRATAVRQSDDLMRSMTQDRGVPAHGPRSIPEVRTAPHANDWHVLSWVYRGTGYLDIGDRRYERHRGVAIWIPAGVEHVTGLREGSVSLPLADASPGDLQLTEPLQTQFSPAWDDYLMFCSVSARSWLRPDNYDPKHMLGLFDEQIAAQRALSVPMPSSKSARAAATDFLRVIATSDRSATWELPAEVHRAFREETGMTFARWRHATRMRVARDLLAGGGKPSAVARRVGYAHLPNFSAAFTRFHGISPREYQEGQ